MDDKDSISGIPGPPLGPTETNNNNVAIHDLVWKNGFNGSFFRVKD